MSAQTDSCIVCQFAHYASLTEAETELLESLERVDRAMPAGTTIRLEGEKTENFFTLKSGWAIAEQHLANGQRQIIDVFVPGQIVGLREIAYETGLCTFSTLTDAVVCPFPKQRITEIFAQSARLTDLFFLILAREQATLVERITNLGRRSAIQKVAHFLLELHERLALSNPSMGSTIRLPMTQRCIGDTLGLSSVHISRSFSRLTLGGLISRSGSQITINNKSDLQELAGFSRAYLDIDLSWLRAHEP